MSNRRFRRVRKGFSRPQLEFLETRDNPTVHLYVDFGDAFGAAGLNMTGAQLEGTFANGGLQGPPLGLFGLNDMTITSLGDDVIGVIDYNEDGVFDDQDYLDLKEDVLSIVSRVYEPFNVIVQEVANSSVATIQGEMTSNNGNPVSTGIYDSYVIVGKFVDTATGTSFGPPNGLLGIAGVDPGFTPGNKAVTNNLDNTVVVFHDTIFEFVSNSNELATLLAFTIAHEAGHSYTLFHTAFDSLFGLLPPETGQLVGSEIMIGGYTGVQQNFTPMLTRFPLIAGDFNLNPSLTENSYASLANFTRSNIGTKSDASLVADANNPNRPNQGPQGPSYVTGTGANDIIRIVPNGANSARVTVNAYRTESYSGKINVPGTNVSTLAYSIDTTGGILIDAGLGNDQIIIAPGLDTQITVRGMGGTDSLTIDGNNTADLIYVPDGESQIGFDGESDRRGTLILGNTTINFQEFELNSRISIENVTSFTFQSPGGADNLELINSGPAIRVRGTINGGQNFIPISVFNATSVVLDTGVEDPLDPDNNDLVILRNVITAPGVAEIQVKTGLGEDVFQIYQSRLDLPGTGGGISFFGGDGNDRLEFYTGEVILGANERLLFDGGDGDDVLDFRIAELNLQRTAGIEVIGGGGNDTVLMRQTTVFNFSFDGGEGDDVLSIAGKLVVPQGGNFAFLGGEGDDTLALGGNVFTGKTATFLYDGGVGDNAVGSAGTSRSRWVIGNGTVTLNQRLNFNNVQSVRGGPGIDEFILTEFSTIAGTLDGGGGENVLNLSALRNVRVNLTVDPQSTTGIRLDSFFNGQALPVVTGVRNVIGSNSPGDLLVGANSIATWLISPTSGSYQVGQFKLGYSGFERLIGGDNSDTLFVTSGVIRSNTAGKGTPARTTLQTVTGLLPGQLFDGGLGNDRIRINGSVGADAFQLGLDTISIRGQILTYSNTETLELFGAGGNDVFNVPGLAYSVDKIVLFGGGGTDVFNVAPSPTAKIEIFGTAPNVPQPQGDTVRLIGASSSQIAGLRPAPNASAGRLNFLFNLMPIDFFGISRLLVSN